MKSGMRFVRLVFAVFILIAVLAYAFPEHHAYAAQITSRSLLLQAGASDGGSKPSGVVNHLFSFTLPTAGNVGSIKFEYCTIAIGSCTTPPGLVTTSASMGSQSGATGFTLVNTTNGAPYITRTAASISATTAVSYQLLTVTNPNNTQCFSGTTPQSNNCTFFVRITSYDDANLTGSAVDTGVVAASTNTQITLTGTMPESLVFCTGQTVSTTGGVPDCSTATTGAIGFNQLFSPTDTATATSQMAASTNASSGYNISVNGTTLTSGSNTITAMAGSTTGVKGTSQFGINLKANTTSTSNPAIGTEVAPVSNGTNYRGEALTGYSTVDNFKYVTGDSIADSGFSSLSGSDAQIFTISYMVNVNGSQSAGTYTTTLTYICTPTY
jgi:hypothetical protein